MNMTLDKINELLGIKESYQASDRLMELLFDDKTRKDLFDKFLDVETNVDEDWFTRYFQEEHADRKGFKQDFTPPSITNLLTRIASGPDKGYETYHEVGCGSGAILVKAWDTHRRKTSPLFYDPRNYWYHAEELSDRALPFLLFNMSIRGMNGVVMHGDSITREFKEVYFIRNDSDDFLAYSEILPMPHTEDVEEFLDVRKWI